MAAPVPSVACNQRRNMEIRANVAEERGMKPYWQGSRAGNTTGFTDFSITKPSAIFDSVDVRDIGLRSLL